MKDMSISLITFSLLVVIFSNFSPVSSELVIDKVTRTIDLTSQVARVSLDVFLENKGSIAVNTFHLAIDPELVNHLAYADVSEKSSEEDDEKYKVSAAPGTKDTTLEVTMPRPLNAGQKINLNVEQVFTHVLTPFPTSIGQSEKQLVVFKGNHYLLSPYLVKQQTTVVRLSSAVIESHSKLKPTTVSDTSISYGPYSDIPPNSKSEMKVHFENNSPFLNVVEMTRWIEVSHWGNIAVEETYHVKHAGATLKGVFSRYDYQRTPTYAAIKSFKTVLPAAATDVYYRDEIGNISTSHMLTMDDSVELELRPRFPLFGGWQTKYYIGYNVPSYEYLYNKGDHYALKMMFIDHVFDDFVIDKLTVKVVLPEGVSNVKVVAPYKVKEHPREVHHTYLDVVGRPVIVLEKDNVVESHIQDFQVHYVFRKVLLLQEPLLVVGAFYLLFLTVIILVRLDFSITKDVVKESRMKAAGLVEELQSLLDRRNSLYSSYEAAIDKYKSTRESGNFTGTLKKVNGDYTALGTKIAQVMASLTKEDVDCAEKLQDLQRKETERKQLMEQAVVLAQKVIGGKLSKQQYVDNESNNHAKRDKLAEEIESIAATF